MDKFSIRDIENLTGIKAHTIRIWEKRYKLPEPKRKESSHRFYDSEDLRNILKITYLYHCGHKISKIACSSVREMDHILATVTKNNQQPHLHVNRLIAASLDFDEEDFTATLDQAIEQHGFESTVKNVIYPYFEKIGLLWMTNHVLPAQEHFASNLVRNRIISAIDHLKSTKHHGEPITILFTPEGEMHELPLLFAAYLFKKHQKHYVYHGTNISIDELSNVCEIVKPQTLYFHLITNLTKRHIDDYLQELSIAFPKLDIVMAGPLSSQATKLPPNCRLLRTPEENTGYISQ